MGEIALPNGISNGNINGVNGQSHSLNGYRKSCWYEEEIEEDLRWCFALNRYIYLYFSVLRLPNSLVNTALSYHLA